MKTGRYYLSYILRKIWLLFAVLTVSLALVISLLRYSLPYMHSQKDFIQDWLSDNYGAEVEIGYISAMWKGRGPAIVLKDLTLVKNENSPIAFSVDETQVELDLLTSLRSWQIHSKRFNLIGMEMQADLERIQQGDSDFPIVDALQTLFLEQLQRFSISSSTVKIKTRLDEQQIQIQQLSWLNKGTRHQGVGEMRVAELARNSARFVLDLTGEKDELQGTFYAAAEDLDVSPWIKQFVPTEYDLKTSRGNFQLWAGLHNSEVTSIQAQIHDSSFEWKGEAHSGIKPKVKANILKGNFTAIPNSNGWLFNLNDFIVLVNNKALDSNWSGTISETGTLTFNNREAVKLAPMVPLLGVLMGTEQGELINNISPTLQLDSLHVEVSSEQAAAQLYFSELGFSELNMEGKSGIPGVKEINGSVHWLDKLAKMKISATDGELKSGRLLGYNVPYSHLELEAFLDFSEGVRVFAPNLSIDGPELSVQSVLHYDSENGMMQLVSKLNDMDVSRAKSLFPTNLMGVETTTFLNKTLHEGDVSDLQVIWSGVPTEFPFEHNQGVFQAAVTLSNGKFEFDESWPMVEELNVALLFENKGLYMVSDHARILDVTVNDVVADIPNLGEGSILNIDVKGKTTGTLATGLVQASSLQDSVGQALDFVQVSGPVDLDVELIIPLTGVDIQVKGEVGFNNNPIYLPDLDIHLTQTQGLLSFHNDDIKANNLHAHLWGQPVVIKFNGAQGQDAYLADVNVQAEWNVDKLAQDYHKPLDAYLDGVSQWTADLALTLPEEGFNYSLQLTSQLQGLDVTAPQPFAKTADSQRLLFLDSEGDATVSTVRMMLGSDVKFNGIFPHAERQFSRAHLSIGDDNFVGMGLGFSVSAQLEDFAFTPWYQFMDDLIAGIPNGEKPFLSPPQRVYIDAGKVLFAGQELNKVNILAKNRQDDWLVNINAEQARAEAILSKDLYAEGIKVDADYINIAEWKEEDPEKSSELDFSQLPPLQIRCAKCQVQGYELGKVVVDLSRQSTGMHIDLLSLEKNEGVITASGDWFISESGNSTLLKGEFRSNDFGGFLKDMDYESGIRDSDATMNFDLSWNQTPFDLPLDSLNGQIDWRLGDGYLTEVSDKGARIFSFLSLESLIRKLTLDFRDVFARGFFYEKMDGSFQIVDGRLSTQDTHIDGAAAKVDIQGFTDLSDKKLNYTVSVQPNLTSSLPVLLAWMVNPATAVAALAFDEVLTSANVVSNIKYSLTGTLSEPKVELLDKSSKSVELPAKKQEPEPTPSSDPILPEPIIESKGLPEESVESVSG